MNIEADDESMVTITHLAGHNRKRQAGFVSFGLALALMAALAPAFGYLNPTFTNRRNRRSASAARSFYLLSSISTRRCAAFASRASIRASSAFSWASSARVLAGPIASAFPAKSSFSSFSFASVRAVSSFSTWRLASTNTSPLIVAKTVNATAPRSAQSATIWTRVDDDIVVVCLVLNVAVLLFVIGRRGRRR